MRCHVSSPRSPEAPRDPAPRLAGRHALCPSDSLPSSHPMRRLLILSLVLLHLALQTSEAADRPSTPPNIVFIIADDLGWGDLSRHGGIVPTPRIDALAEGGLELVRHYVAPVCSPTRAGLMTGRYWSRFGVTTPRNERALPWTTLTLPKALKQAGYDTCLTGKWHLGSLPDEGPNQFGFDHSYGSLAGGVSPWNHLYKKGKFSQTWHRNGSFLEESGHVTDLITTEATRWIASRGKNPFFLYVPFTAVHLPLKEPAEWLARVPASVTGAVPRHYAACLMHLDDAVGRILDTLEHKGFSKNTLVIFTSDNGGSTAENNDPQYPDDACPNGNLPGSNRPLRDGKGSVYEGGIRVPTFVSWSGQLRKGSVANPVHITDWMPTLCGLAGARPVTDPRWDGVDLWPQLNGANPATPRSIYTAGPNFTQRALHSGDWKLILKSSQRKGDPSATSTTTQLFHLAKDPNETQDLASSNPEKVAELESELAKISQNDKDSLPTD